MAFDIDGYLRSQCAAVVESGDERIVRCPSCGKEGKFYANTVTTGFICFAGSCGLRGRGVIDLICAVEGVSRREAERRIMRYTRAHREIPKVTLEDMLSKMRVAPSQATRTDVPLPPEFSPCFDGKRWRWPSYLTKREITKEAAAHFGIGYARGGRYRGRIILPFSCPNGSSFVGRDTTGKSIVKYLSPKKTEGHEAKRLVFGWPKESEAESWDGAEIFIVEGPLDVVRMWQHGLPALSLLGKLPSAEKMDMLATLNASAFIVMLDPEEVEAPTETATKLAALVERVYVAKLPDGVDPGSSTAEQVRAAYMAAERFTGRRGRDLVSALAASGRLVKRI